MPLQYNVLLHVQTYNCSIIIIILIVLLLTALPTRVMSTMIIIIKIYTQGIEVLCYYIFTVDCVRFQTYPRVSAYR